MKILNIKVLSIIFILSCFLNCVKAQSKNKITYENGNIKETGQIAKNGNRTGEWKFYYETGEILQVGIYENGNPIGVWKTYFRNGNLDKIGKFSNGKATGEWKEHYKTGELYEIGVFDGEDRIGEFKWYYENGNLKEQLHKHSSILSVL